MTLADGLQTVLLLSTRRPACDIAGPTTVCVSLIIHASCAVAGTDAQAPVRNIFPFQYKPNTLDRDHIVAPAGGIAGERDLDDSPANEEPGAKKLYSALVPDQGPKVRRHNVSILLCATSDSLLPALHSTILYQNKLSSPNTIYDENARKRDARMSSGNPADLAGAVEPLQSSSFHLPNVDRALSDMETGIRVAAPPISNNVEARRLGVTDIGSGASTYWAGGVYLDQQQRRRRLHRQVRRDNHSMKRPPRRTAHASSIRCSTSLILSKPPHCPTSLALPTLFPVATCGHSFLRNNPRNT